MSLSSEITRLMSAKADLKSAIEGKGVPVPSATKLDGYASLVGSITGGGTPTLQSKFIAFTPAETIQISTVTADSGYDGLSTVNVSVNAIPSAYVIPSGSLSISANGTYNVEAFARAEVMVSGSGGSDYWAGVVDGTLSEAIDYQGSFSRIGSYAFYSMSTISIASFLNAETIDIYAFCNCSNLTTINFPETKSIASNAFASCAKITSACFSKLQSTGSYVFANCSSLSLIEMPLLQSINSYLFQNCIGLTTVSFQAVYSINTCAFRSCFKLSAAIFSHSNSSNARINQSAFVSCYNLLSLYLLGSVIYNLGLSTVFASTPISNYTTSTGGVQGSIFVPESLYSTYKSATNWATYADRFASLTNAQISNVLTYGTHNPT